MRLIDIEAPCKIEIELDGEKCHATVTAPTIQVVRCKDCRFWESEHSYCPDMMRRTEASGFCAWGERKDDE